MRSPYDKTVIYEHPAGVAHRRRLAWWDGFGAGVVVGFVLLSLVLAVMP